MKKHYITAVVELLQKGRDVDAVLSNLKTTLAKRGHEKLHAQILKGVANELSLRENTQASTIVVAKASDAALWEKAIEDALQKLGSNEKDAQIIIDATLIGGFIASHKGRLINRSYKEKLVSLYRSITK